MIVNFGDKNEVDTIGTVNELGMAQIVKNYEAVGGLLRCKDITELRFVVADNGFSTESYITGTVMMHDATNVVNERGWRRIAEFEDEDGAVNRESYVVLEGPRRVRVAWVYSEEDSAGAWMFRDGTFPTAPFEWDPESEEWRPGGSGDDDPEHWVVNDVRCSVLEGKKDAPHPDGFPHKYHVRHADDDVTLPASVEKDVTVNHWGILFAEREFPAAVNTIHQIRDDDDEDGIIIFDVRLGPPKYVNVYMVFRNYGGPEEGGWWYDAGRPVVSVKLEGEGLLEQQSVVKFLDGLFPKPKHRLGSVLSPGEHVVVVEDHPARAYPQKTPRYE